MNDFAAYLACFGSIGALCWGAIKGFDAKTDLSPKWNAIFASAIGVAGGLACYGMGFVKVPSASPLWGYVGSGFFGLLAAFAAAGATSSNLLSAVKKDETP